MLMSDLAFGRFHMFVSLHGGLEDCNSRQHQGAVCTLIFRLPAQLFEPLSSKTGPEQCLDAQTISTSGSKAGTRERPLLVILSHVSLFFLSPKETKRITTPARSNKRGNVARMFYQADVRAYCSSRFSGPMTEDPHPN